MNIKSCVLSLVIAIATDAAFANIYFKGQPVHGASTAACPVDVMRLLWGGDEANAEDRIQGQIMLGKDAPHQGQLKIIVQGLDSSGQPIGAYALSTGYYVLNSDGFEHVDYKNRSEYRRAAKKVDPGWFYFDFEKDPQIKSFLIANVVLNEREVHHNLRLVGNRLTRSMTTLPRIKQGRRGDFYETTEWVPPPAKTAENELMKKPNTRRGAPKQADSASISLIEKNDEIAGETHYSAQVNWTLKSNGATFSFVPSVKSDGTASTMTVILSGNTGTSLGYAFRLGKILLFDSISKERLALDESNTANWPRFYLSTKRSECRLDLPQEATEFFARMNEIRCRFAFELSNSTSGRNFDCGLSKEQVTALRKLAEKCLELQTGLQN